MFATLDDDNDGREFDVLEVLVFVDGEVPKEVSTAFIDEPELCWSWWSCTDNDDVDEEDDDIDID